MSIPAFSAGSGSAHAGPRPSAGIAWGLTDGSAGMAAQVRALADACEFELEEKTIAVKAPWSWFPVIAYSSPMLQFLLPKHLRENAPDVVISCGRRGAMIALLLKKIARSTKFICIQDPRISPKHFDVVVAMEHDKIYGANVIKTPYALHNITEEKLAAARAEWTPKFNHQRRPWNAVLIGGSTNKYRLSSAAMQKLIMDIEHIDGALFITTSRRTGEDNIKALMAPLQNNGRTFIYTGKGENPYLGMLACADHVYVTNDSVNMMSEALASGKPVSILKLQGHKKTKPARFADKLNDQKISPQQMMRDVAVRVKELLGGAAA